MKPTPTSRKTAAGDEPPAGNSNSAHNHRNPQQAGSPEAAIVGDLELVTQADLPGKILKSPNTHPAFRLLRLVLLLALTIIPFRAAVAQTVSLDKIYTFPGAFQTYGYVDSFYDAPLVLGTGVNTTLWFTAQKGGLDGEGDLVKFNLSSKTLTVMGLNFGGATEIPPGSGEVYNDPARSEASPVYDNGDGTKNYLYFTTVAGGVTGTASLGGTLVRYDMDTNTYTKVWEAPAAAAGGLRQPRGAVAIVDRGAAGKDIYFTASGGGAAPSTSAGGILRYNTNTGITSTVADFDGVAANMPYDGFVRVGDKLYLTTFAGGPGPATGNGTLSAVDVSAPANPTFSVLGNLPGTTTSGPGSGTRIGGSTPIYDSERNSLYFTVVGSNGTPGALMKFSLESGVISSLHEMAAGNNTGPNPEGRQAGYNSPFLYESYLYYVSRNGGANDLGTIKRFNLEMNTNEVLFHLTAETGGTVYGDFGFADFDFNSDGTPDPSLYFMTTGAAADGVGTILRVSNLDAPAAVPEPGSTVLCLFGALFALNARRRKTS